MIRLPNRTSEESIEYENRIYLLGVMCFWIKALIDFSEILKRFQKFVDIPLLLLFIGLMVFKIIRQSYDKKTLILSVTIVGICAITYLRVNYLYLICSVLCILAAQNVDFDRIIGKVGIVIKEIKKHENGRVKIDGKDWMAISDDEIKYVTPNATLKCNGETDASKIGALTADEVAFAGGTNYMNIIYYLVSGGTNWWTLSHSEGDSGHDYVFCMYNTGELGRCDVTGGSVVYGSYDSDVRPAVSLNTGAKIISGEGTKGNPYIINEG